MNYQRPLFRVMPSIAESSSEERFRYGWRIVPRQRADGTIRLAQRLRELGIDPGLVE
jgi:hypothetical protein